MRALLVTGLVLASVLGISLFLPQPEAQSADQAVGTIFLTSHKLREADTLDCGPMPTYNMTHDYPGVRDGSKAYLGRSLVAGCTTSFEYNTTVPFHTSGNFSVMLHIGCDAATPVVQSGFASVQIRRNATAIGNATWNAPGVTCPTGTPWKLQVKIPTKNTMFNESDKLALRLGIRAPNTEESLSERFHVRVGNATFNSSIQAPGIPLGIPLPPAGDTSHDTNAPPTTASTTATTSASPTGTTSTTGTTATTTAGPTTTTAGTAGTASQTGTATAGTPPVTSSTTGPAGASPADETGFAMDDAGETKDISGEAMPAPGLAIAAATIIAGVLLLRRRRT